MKRSDIIRAWKDTEYRATLTDAELAALPDHPSGIVELPDSELANVAGGNTEAWSTLGCCRSISIIGGCGLTVGYRTVGCCPYEVD